MYLRANHRDMDCKLQRIFNFENNKLGNIQEEDLHKNVVLKLF